MAPFSRIARAAATRRREPADGKSPAAPPPPPADQAVDTSGRPIATEPDARIAPPRPPKGVAPG